MKILLVQDDTIKINLQKSADVLNKICEALEFNVLPKVINFGNKYIQKDKEIKSLSEELQNVKRDYTIFLTTRKYQDNWFWHSSNNIMILSFFGWKHYTNLPLENGLFYFICDTVVQRIDIRSRHYETTGCLYDFLATKTAVDIGMKRGFICPQCLKRISEKTNKSERSAKILVDVFEILKSLSNASKLGNNVLDLLKKDKIPDLDWSTFEDEVSQLYRELGASVQQNASLSGFQIDVFVKELTPSKQEVRSAIDCKYYQKKVGNKTVNDFSKIVNTLKVSRIVDKGVIVAFRGFSKDAYTVAQNTGIELLDYKELKHRAKQKKEISVKEPLKTSKQILIEKVTESEKRIERSPEIFVVMPFSDDLDDLYHLGILETARELQCHCERVDQMEYTGSVLEKIYELIENAEVIVAEVTSINANVYYEIGYSHALKKPTILITKDIESAPFDLKGQNHIIYKNIRDLKTKLRKRLEAILGII